ncbi:alpha/beta hydrolase [Microbacterium sp. HD4P20]|uniref:alpha/beta fold hydrolase n=1 Tax=Microbacterium sp. HD4P20 TaxID=2864874 RepID=UPI001C63C336|nr:alpha/beta hydrolase [Microbacterium sp. HD4P20]MCP2635705.1 alpha/beta hydrolase [Microbacterium sp. HD4P20]
MRLIERTPHTTRTGGDGPDRPRRRPVLRSLLVVAFGVAAFIAGMLAASGHADVGQFASRDGQRAYIAAYEEALAEAPRPPDAQEDVRTTFGVVRMLRWDAAHESDPAPDPLVLLPGTQSGAPVWVDNIASLAATRAVYVVDLLGQPGRSVQGVPVTSAAEDAAWLAEALEAIDGPKHVLGHSIGGWIAMNLAIHEPDAASSITVLDPVQTFGDLSMEAVVRSIPASLPWLPRSWREDFASWTANGAAVEDEPVADMIEAAMQNYRLGSPPPARFSDEQLAGVRLPVLVIMAGASVMHDSRAAAEVAERTLVDGTVEVYDDASHAITGEEPQRVADDVNAFLNALQD